MWRSREAVPNEIRASFTTCHALLGCSRDCCGGQTRQSEGRCGPENINRSAFGNELPLDSFRLIKHQASTAFCPVRMVPDRSRVYAIFLSARYTIGRITNLIGYLVFLSVGQLGHLPASKRTGSPESPQSSAWRCVSNLTGQTME